MKQLFVLIIILVCMTMLAAKPITPETATRIATNVIWERTGQRANPNAVTPIFSTSRQAQIHVVTLLPKGFVIVSGDDEASPILGFSLEGSWNEAELPIQLQAEIDNWLAQLDHITQHGLKADSGIRQLWQHYDCAAGQFTPMRDNRAVSPLITSTWGQGSPYNAQCPSGTPVGCVATAMSQIMRYWAYPTTGYSSHSYNHPVYGTQSADFGNTVYNWAGMPNAVASANVAVATICRQAGVAVDMDYAPDGSGAYSFDVPNAMSTYFKYKDTISWKQKNSYSDAVWNSMMVGELDNYRPVYYSGSSVGSGGHAFILDGYNGTDYFHVNWGWYGYNNGYFYLSALNPGTDNFSSSQQAVIGIQPRETLTNLGEGFEGTTFPPSNWTVTAGTFARSATNYITGAYSARYYAGGATSGKQLRTPKLTIDASSPAFTFKAKRASTGRSEQIKVGYSASATGPYSFLNTFTLGATAATFSTTVSGLTPGDYYFVLETYSTNGLANQYKTYIIDDVAGPQLWVDPNPIANLNITSWAAGSLTPGNSTSSGLIFMLTNVGRGVLTVNSVTDLSSSEFSTSFSTSIALVAGQSHEFSFNYDPIDYSTDNASFVINTTGGTVTVNLSGTGQYAVFSDGYESYTNFTLNITPWTQYDGDTSATYGIDGVTYTNSGYTGAYMVFNPSATSPAVSGGDAHGGSKYAACFAATTPPNNDWLITPQLSFGRNPRISFWARSYTDAYGLERFKVLVTDTGNSYSNFSTYLAGSATTYVSAPLTWTQYTYNLPANYADNSSVYIAIQCVSNDAFILMIDDFMALDDSTPAPPELGHFNGYVYRYGTTTPIPNALVQIGSKSAYTNASGFFQINNILVGTYSATASTPGAFYFPSTVNGISITNGVTANRDFLLTWAEIGVNQSAFTSNLYLGQNETQTLSITNPGGTANLAYQLTLSPAASSMAQPSLAQRSAPKRNYNSVPKLTIPADDRIEGWIAYGDIADVAFYSSAVAERATKYTISDFGMWSSGVTITQLRHYFYELSTDPWGTNNTFVFKIYAADGTTVLYSSPSIVANPQTTEWVPTVHTLTTPLYVSTDFWVAIRPVDQTGGKPLSLAADNDYGSSFSGSAGSWTGMGMELITAAYINGDRWISTGQSSGVVNPGGVSNVALNFSTASLAAGTKSAFLTIYNNSNYIAPSGVARGDNMVIPITLVATEASEPLVWLNNSQAAIVSPVNSSNSTGAVYQIKNIGTGTLTITSATLTGTGFTTSFNDAITLGQNQTHDFGFTFSPLVSGVHNGSFTIVTNGGTVAVILKGYGGYQAIDFEGETFPPSGWSAIDNDNDTYNWQVLANAAYAHGGTNCATSASYVNTKGGDRQSGRGALTPDNWLITPRLRIKSGDELSYYIGALDPAWPAEKYSVLVSTTDDRISSFNDVIYTETLSDGAYHLQTHSLDSFAGMDIFIAFRHYDCTDQYMLRLDDVLLPPLAPNSPLPAINPSPANSTTVYSFMPGTVNLSWVSNPSGIAATGYKLYFNGELVEANLIQPSWTTSTLSANTYTWQVIPFTAGKSENALQVANRNSKGDATDCPVWSFAYEPNVILPDTPSELEENVVVTQDGDTPLQYESDITEYPALNNPTFIPNYAFKLSGTGNVNIIIQTTATWASYNEGGGYTYVQAVDGVISFTANFSAKGDVFIILGDIDDTLPVTLSAFTAVLNVMNYVTLTWVTESETNCTGYQIYRGETDALADAILLNVFISATNTSQQQSYIYTDNEVTYGGVYYYWLESLDLDGTNLLFGPLSIDLSMLGDNPTPPIPLKTELGAAYPNPFNPSTTIQLSLKERTPVILDIYNVAGQKVVTLVQGELNAGYHKIVWKGTDNANRPVSSGVYFYKVKAGIYTSTKKMVMLK